LTTELALVPKLRRFIVVGGLGFAIDGGLLMLLLASGVDVLPARLFSFLCAVSATWLFNRTWTFKAGASRAGHAEYMRYFATQAIGAGINLCVFFVFLALHPALRQTPILPFIAGAAAALFFNFFAANKYVFTSGRGQA
jgi:putative flippase GtrA